MKPPQSDLSAAAGIASIVLPRREGPPRRVTGFALLVGLTLHLGVGWASAMLPEAGRALGVAARPAVRVSLVRDVAVAPPAPVDVPSPPAPVTARLASRPRPAGPAAPTPPSEPAPAGPADAAEPARAAPDQAAELAPAAPARAAEVVQTAARADAPAPEDFSIVSGEAPAYAGGVTGSTGASASAVRVHGSGARHGVLGGQGAGAGAPRSQARPVGQPTRAWRCDWPSAASDLDVDVEFVNMRVAVEASGEITDVRVVRHSGYGFDVEAARCALRHRLPPARDAQGAPVRTASHPLRLRFER